MNNQWFFNLCILHLLLIILSLGCKVFISASPRMQRYCRLVMKNSVLVSLIWVSASPRTHKPKIVNESLNNPMNSPISFVVSSISNFDATIQELFKTSFGQWFRSLRMPIYYLKLLKPSRLMFGGAEPFMQFWKRTTWGRSCEFVWNLDKSEVVQEKISLLTKDRQTTIAHLEQVRKGPNFFLICQKAFFLQKKF